MSSPNRPVYNSLLDEPNKFHVKELDFAEFVRELKAKLSFEEQEELMFYFDKRKSEVRDIVARIEATDKEIDEMVFELYGLTEEEKKVVLESNGK